MKIKILTLFPEMFTGFLNSSIIKRAIDEKIVEISLVDIRLYSNDKHHHVDDTPYGGGAGMVLRVDVVSEAIKANKGENSKVIMMSPQGVPYKEKKAYELASNEEIILLCGHYEGFDERIRSYVDEEISIGDFVLTGGELPAMCVADSVIRLLDGAITKESHLDDSFSDGLLEYPQYTRPLVYDNMEVPFVLTNGNHKEINKFRHEESLKRTFLKRPDLLKDYNLTLEDKKIIEELCKKN